MCICIFSVYGTQRPPIQWHLHGTHISTTHRNANLQLIHRVEDKVQDADVQEHGGEVPPPLVGVRWIRVPAHPTCLAQAVVVLGAQLCVMICTSKLS